MAENGVKELVKRMQELKSEITKLSAQLNDLNKQKGEAYHKKELIRQKKMELIKSINKEKTERDSLTSNVKESKEKRNKLHQEIRKQHDELKAMEKEKRDYMEKYRIQDPIRVKQELDHLETKLETQPMAFEKEKELMKKIKALKKKYEDGRKLHALLDKIRGLRKSLHEDSKDAEEMHKLVQDKARESQGKHEGVMKNVRELEMLEKEDEERFKSFSALKQGYKETDEKLREKLRELGEIRKKLDLHYESQRKARLSKEALVLMEKEQLIEDKIKRGEKLTTDDLLVFQTKR